MKTLTTQQATSLNKGRVFSNEEIIDILEFYIDDTNRKPRHIAELMEEKHGKDYSSQTTRKYIYDAINFRKWTILTLPKLREYFSDEEIKISFPKAWKVLETHGFKVLK